MGGTKRCVARMNTQQNTNHYNGFFYANFAGKHVHWHDDLGAEVSLRSGWLDELLQQCNKQQHWHLQPFAVRTDISL